MGIVTDGPHKLIFLLKRNQLSIAFTRGDKNNSIGVKLAVQPSCTATSLELRPRVLRVTIIIPCIYDT